MNQEGLITLAEGGISRSESRRLFEICRASQPQTDSLFHSGVNDSGRTLLRWNVGGSSGDFEGNVFRGALEPIEVWFRPHAMTAFAALHRRSVSHAL